MFEVLTGNLEDILKEIAELNRITKEYQEKINNSKEREAQWNDSLHYMLRLFSNYDSYSDFDKKKLMQRLVKSIQIYPEKKAYGYLKSIEFKFPIFKSALTDEKDTIYTIQDAYPDIIDENGEFTGYDPDEGYVFPEPELDENGCVTVYPDPIEYYEEHGCWPPDHLMNESSKLALQYWEEHKKQRHEKAMEYWEEHKDEYKNSSPPRETHGET